MGDDVNLVEDDRGVQDVECGVIDCTSQDNILEELQPICVVDLALSGFVADGYWLVEF